MQQCAMFDDRLRQARAWFSQSGREPFGFQEETWRALWQGESGLLNAGTGTGKTLSAWIGCLLDDDADPEARGVRVLWLTPLRGAGTRSGRGHA